MSNTHLPVAELVRRCGEETEKFSRRQENDPQFCFELMRRALADESHEAFAYIFRVYERQVLIWVHSHSHFASTGEEAEYFVSSAFSALYFARHGERFSGFGGLPQVLSYLKLCVHTSIMQYLRDQKTASLTGLDTIHELGETPELDAEVSATELWNYICTRLPDERNRRLARYVFIDDLKPRQIVKLDRSEWRDEREVTVAIYRLRQLLRGDSDLRRHAGLVGSETPDERFA